MKFGDILRAARKRWTWAVSFFGCCLIAAAVAAYFSPVEYESTETLYVAAANRAGTAQDMSQGQTFITTLMPSLTWLATSGLVLEGVQGDLALDATVEELAGRITAQNPRETSMLSITARADNAPEAQALARATANRVEATYATLSKGAGASTQIVSFNNVQDAQMPTYPIAPNRWLYLLVGLLVALLAVGVAVATDAYRDLLATRHSNLGETRSDPDGVVRPLRPIGDAPQRAVGEPVKKKVFDE